MLRRMPVADNNVLSDGRALSQNSYRSAVAAVINAIKLARHASDQDMADALDVSATTINNASNRRGNLDAVTLLRIGARYGIDRLSPVLALIGAKAAAMEAGGLGPLHDLSVGAARGQLFLAKALADATITDRELLEGGAEIEAAYSAFARLQYRLDALRTEREG
jgi:hypothetical protein